jgi:hypothetical protein
MEIKYPIDQTKSYILYIIALDKDILQGHESSQCENLRKILFQDNWTVNGNSTLMISGMLISDLKNQKPLNVEEIKNIICDKLINKPECYIKEMCNKHCKIKICEFIKDFTNQNKQKEFYSIYYTPKDESPKDEEFFQLINHKSIFSNTPHILINHS